MKKYFKGTGILVILVYSLGIGIQSSAAAPPGSAPRNVRANYHSPTSVVVEWEEPDIPNGVIMGYKVFYTSHNDLPLVLWERKDATNTNSRMATIRGLDPNKTYTISLLAYSDSGQGPLSEPFKIVDRQGVPLQLVANAVSPTEIELRWDEPIDVITSYTIYYNDSSSYQIGQTRFSAPATMYKMAYLIPDTVYSIQLSGRRKKGKTVKSPVLQVRTPEFIPAAPTHVRLTAVNSTSLFVEWRPANPNLQHRIIRGYYIYYVKLDNNGDAIFKTERSFDVDDPDINANIIGGLDPDSTYSVTVAAYTRRGDGVRSRPRLLTTAGAVPSAPLNLKVEFVQVDPPIMRASWQKPMESHGDVVNYKLYWGVKAQVYQEIILPPGRMVYTTPLLEAGTVYEFRVIARNDIDYGASAVAEMTTPNNEEEPIIPMRPPVGLNAIVFSANKIVLTWKDDSLGITQIITDTRYYTIRYRTIPAGSSKYKFLNSTDLNKHIEDLKPNTLYEFAVKVTKGRRTSTWSMAHANKTHEAAPGSMPRDLTIVPVKGDPLSVILKWQPPAMPNGEITGYLVFYTTDSSQDDIHWVVEGVFGDILTITLTELTEDTTYYLKVQARNDKGYGPMSTTTFYKTPRKMSNKLEVQQIGPRNAMVRLKSPAEYNKTTTHTVYVYDSMDKTEPVFEVKLKGGVGMLNDLHPSTEYLLLLKFDEMIDRRLSANLVAYSFSLQSRASTALFLNDAIGEVYEARGQIATKGAGPKFTAIDKTNDNIILNLSSFHRVAVSSYTKAPCPKKKCGMLKLFSHKLSGAMKQQMSLMFADDMDFVWAKAHL